MSDTKSITSEVPSDFVGSLYNDYLVLQYVLKKDNMKNVSQRMNGLGLGAFDSSDATDRYALQLTVIDEPERIQVDVGVANIGDSLLQSSVIVDNIGIEKCAGCNKCKSAPMG